jgi:tRNA A-37 threonylcarbamoyl transferase component Bud32/tetratricopeptide (TPR) repeat protein
MCSQSQQSPVTQENEQPVACFAGQLRHCLVTGHEMNEPDKSQNRSEKEIFFEALDKKTPEERAAFLDGACGKDAARRARVEALLADHFQQDTFMKQPAVGGESRTVKLGLPDTPDEAVGQRLGRYKLLERVGEGGCGVVYVAEQVEPVRRRVALKVIKLGMDTKAVVARFEAERQALAMMDHPNIAKVFDAGTTETGRPYFVMELVRGIRMTDYCDQANLSTKERLDLFIKVCQAIQHAHQKGIIHRDIKPSNILVTLHDGVPVPKVIDFGIAKATEGRLTEATVYTQLHQFIGTPAYMSPEQAEMSGLDIDTRSDIYSLGVLLYELLAGSTPFDAQELMAYGLDAMRKTIREKEPIRPSTRVATLKGEELTTAARRRSCDVPKLINLLKGDLDSIVMMCLEKDRRRRYETANGLASDVLRHVNNELVLARPPSNMYRFQKMVRRNKLRFTAASLMAVMLLAVTGISLYLAISYKDALALEPILHQREEQVRLDEAYSRIAWPPKWAGTNITVMLSPLAEFRARHGLWSDAAVDYSKLVELEPTNYEYYHSLAALLVRNGDLEGYRRLCAQALARFEGTRDPRVPLQLAKDCLILQASGVDLGAVKQLAETAKVIISTNDIFSSWQSTNGNFYVGLQFVKGLAEYRQGHFAGAVELEQKVLAVEPRQWKDPMSGKLVTLGREDYRNAEAWMVLAMAQHELHQEAQARSSFDKGIAIAETKLPKLQSGDLGDFWENWIIVGALAKEAKELLK